MAVVPATAGDDDPRFEFELEAGPVWQARNEVEIPNDGTATRFSLEKLAGRGAWPTGRSSYCPQTQPNLIPGILPRHTH